MSGLRKLRLPKFLRYGSGIIGLGILMAIIAVAIFGPAFAPHDPNLPIGGPGQPPSGEALLGTDQLGRDVLSRLLYGGLSVFWISIAATVIAYLAGGVIGLVAGYTRSFADTALMRGVDVLLAFPALLVILLLVSGLGSHISVLILGVVLVQVPGIARVIRTATMEASTKGYVEAAVARGERTPSVLMREILPNIAPIALADFGIRFGVSIILIASVNYLGLGLAPPSSDWGLMISENRSYISINVWAVLAPAIMLALFAVSVNLVADAYVRSIGAPSRALRRGATEVTEIPVATNTPPA